MAKLKIKRMPALEYSCREAINTLCTNLTFFDDEKRVIMFTSAQPNEGKSFVVFHTAVTLARLGYSIALVDADLRKSQLVSSYGFQITEGSGYGITHYLAGKCGLDDALYESDVSGLRIMPVGHVVSNSLALLNTDRFHELLDVLREHNGFVIVDAPPVGTIIDAAEISKSCDGCVFVVRYNKTSRREAAEAKKQLDRSGCPVLGAVLNSVEFDTMSSKKYYHKSYYSNYLNKYYKSSADGKSSKNK